MPGALQGVAGGLALVLLALTAAEAVATGRAVHAAAAVAVAAAWVTGPRTRRWRVLLPVVEVVALLWLALGAPTVSGLAGLVVAAAAYRALDHDPLWARSAWLYLTPGLAVTARRLATDSGMLASLQGAALLGVTGAVIAAARQVVAITDGLRRAAAREAIVARAGRDMTAAASAEQAAAVAADAARDLAGGGPVDAAVLLGPDDVEVAATAGPRSAALRGTRHRLADLPQALQQAVAGAAPVGAVGPVAVPAQTPQGVWPTGTLCVGALRLGADHGLLVVTRSRGDFPDGMRDGLEALAALLRLGLTRLRTTAQLAAAEARFRGVVEHASGVLLLLDAEGRITFSSATLQPVLGYPPASVHDRPLSVLVHPEDMAAVQDAADVVAGSGRSGPTVQCRMRAADGRAVPMEVVVVDLLGAPGVEALVVHAHDVSERTVLRERLDHMALHDGLTGLANRRLLLDLADRLLARATATGAGVTLLVADIDSFREVNDLLGPEQADALLELVAARLSAAVGVEGTVARVASDEFAVLVETGDVGQVQGLVERVRRAFTDPFALVGEAISVQAGIGVATAEQPTTAGTLLTHAQSALRQAKSAGRGHVRAFRPEAHQALVERLELASDLPAAITGDELFCEYQPIVSLTDGRVVACETLVRWRHPGRGVLSPDVFVPVAEESGAVLALGRRVLHEACAAAQGWGDGPAAPAVAVNIGQAQLSQPDIVDEVLAVAQAAGLPPGRLVLEITEHVLVDQLPRLSATCAALRRCGVRLAIDDFGAGQTSLRYLRDVPVDLVKVDKALVQHCDTDARDAAILEAVVRLGASLGLTVIAEGVERQAQRAVLQRMGCPLGQGWLLGIPRSASEVLVARAGPSG